MSITSENDKIILEESEKKIINAISQRVEQQLFIISINRPKNRARARKSIIVKGGKRRYFVELAERSIQKFYLKRSIHYSNFFKEIIKYATVNMPIIVDEIDGIYFAVFPYLDSTPGKPNLNGEKILKALYKENSSVRKISNQSVNEITNAFLNSWPKEYHHYIRYLPEYLKYIEQLQSYDEIVLCPEHGDFALNNILTGLHSKHLIDFEFSRETQPAGFDLYAYRRTTYKTKLFWKRKDYYRDLHSLKFKLNERISFAIDNNLKEIIIYSELTPVVRSKIVKLMNETLSGFGTHLLDSLSFRRKGNEELFYVTIWHDNILSGFAILKKHKNILYPIATEEGDPVIFFKNIYQFGLLIKYMERRRIGFQFDNISKQSDVYKQFNLMREKVNTPINAVAMSAVLEEKTKDRALFELLSEISGYLASAAIKDKDSHVLIYSLQNKKIISKHNRNNFFSVLRLSSRTIRTGIFFMVQRINLKRFLIFLYQYPKIRLRWRKARKKGGALRLRIGDFHAFIRALNQNGVDYVVLRGLHDGNPSSDEDVDFMLKASHILKMIWVAAGFPGSLPCDVYFDTYQSLECYPYYPPVFALRILEKKIKNNQDCYVPDAYHHLMSLLYHITYHKGLTKGFNRNNGKLTPDSKYYDMIMALIESNGFEDHFELSLRGFHQFLKNKNVSMPYDMLVKWPKRNETIDAITEIEKQSLKQELPTDKKNLVVFILREDATPENIIEYIKNTISDNYSILFSKELTAEQINRAIQFTRGGNWVELDKKQFHLVAPYSIVVSQSNSFETTESNTEYLAKECARIKKEIRGYVKENFPSIPKRYLIHSTDSPYEALDYMKKILPQDYIKIIA
ncbi:hypothetical protein [Desulfobacter curvatus]|uniref:hypothetical protein n=1 Tax=Desulfobacter curvatus TaxID=2290 RepID=UPI0003644039|nr:hypothetical protein [Desulfobacter curvatus]